MEPSARALRHSQRDLARERANSSPGNEHADDASSDGGDTVEFMDTAEEANLPPTRPLRNPNDTQQKDHSPLLPTIWVALSLLWAFATQAFEFALRGSAFTHLFVTVFLVSLLYFLSKWAGDGLYAALPLLVRGYKTIRELALLSWVDLLNPVVWIQTFVKRLALAANVYETSSWTLQEGILFGVLGFFLYLALHAAMGPNLSSTVATATGSLVTAAWIAFLLTIGEVDSFPKLAPAHQDYFKLLLSVSILVTTTFGLVFVNNSPNMGKSTKPSTSVPTSPNRGHRSTATPSSPVKSALIASPNGMHRLSSRQQPFLEQARNEFWRAHHTTLTFAEGAPFSIQGMIEVYTSLLHAVSSQKGQQVADDPDVFWRVFTTNFLRQAHNTAYNQNKKTLANWLGHILSEGDTNPTLRDAVSAFSTLRTGNSGALVRDKLHNLPARPDVPTLIRTFSAVYATLMSVGGLSNLTDTCNLSKWP